MIEPGVRLIGNVQLGEGVSIAAPAEVNGTGAGVYIGDGCDIAAFVTIHCSDSHDRCLGRDAYIERRPISIGPHTFIGTGAVILGGTVIGDHCVIGAGVVLKGQSIPPYSRVRSPQPVIEPAFYAKETTTA